MADAPANAAEDLLHVTPFPSMNGENGTTSASQPDMFQPLAAAATATSGAPQQQQPELAFVTPVPSGAPEPSFRWRGQQPSMPPWRYNDAAGRLLGYVARYGSSASGHTTTTRPASGFQSALPAAFEPPGEVTAT